MAVLACSICLSEAPWSYNDYYSAMESPITTSHLDSLHLSIIIALEVLLARAHGILPRVVHG